LAEREGVKKCEFGIWRVEKERGFAAVGEKILKKTKPRAQAVTLNIPHISIKERWGYSGEREKME